MAYVITEKCVGERYATCVEVCPVDCIHPGEYNGEVFMVIHPDNCPSSRFTWPPPSTPSSRARTSLPTGPQSTPSWLPTGKTTTPSRCANATIRRASLATKSSTPDFGDEYGVACALAGVRAHRLFAGSESRSGEPPDEAAVPVCRPDCQDAARGQSSANRG